MLAQIRQTRAGRLTDARYGSRMEGEGPLAQQIDDMFELACRRAGLSREGPDLSISAFRRPPGPQLDLFADR